jgi:hypothetical protein
MPVIDRAAEIAEEAEAIPAWGRRAVGEVSRGGRVVGR